MSFDPHYQADVAELEPSGVLCPEDLRRCHYALNTDRFVCPVHGPVMTTQALHGLAELVALLPPSGAP